MSGDDHALEYLLAFDGEIHQLGSQGYWLKFVVKRVPSSPTRPHGIGYSLTLHDAENHRVFGMDNEHAVDHPGSRHKARPTTFDHEHRHETDRGRPYAYTDAARLIADFFAGVERRLAELGLDANGDPI
jgi:hypothetical protein